MQQKGLTLIHLMATIAIISILATLSLPILNHYLEQTKAVKTIPAFGSLKNSVAVCHLHNDSFKNCDSGKNGIPDNTQSINGVKEYSVEDGIIKVTTTADNHMEDVDNVSYWLAPSPYSTPTSSGLEWVSVCDDYGEHSLVSSCENTIESFDQDSDGDGVPDYVEDNPRPFQCDLKHYVSVQDRLHVLGYDELGTDEVLNQPYHINSIGYNVQDGYIYGIKAGSKNLVKVERSGNYVDLGEVEGLPDSAEGSYIGEFDVDGNYHVIQPNKQKIFNIDIEDNTVVNERDLPQRFGSSDFGYSIENGKMYGLSGNSVIELDLDTLDQNTTSVSNSDIDGFNGFGSVWIDQNENLFAFNNLTGKIFRVDDYKDDNPFATEVRDIDDSGASDGTACIREI